MYPGLRKDFLDKNKKHELQNPLNDQLEFSNSKQFYTL